MLKKRQNMGEDSFEYNESKKIDFIKNHYPEIIQIRTRINYYKDYQFPAKQRELKNYWKNNLRKYFKSFKKGALAYVDDILNFFRIEGSYPICLPKIIMELIEENNYLLLKNEGEFNKMLECLEEKSYFDIFRTKNMISYFKDIFIKKIIESNNILVNREVLDEIVNEGRNFLEDIFDSADIMLESDFIEKIESKFIFDNLDKKALLFILENKFLEKIKENQQIFVFLKNKKSDLTFMAKKQEILINKKIEHLVLKIDCINREIKTITKDCLQKKRENKKKEALELLQVRKCLEKNKKHYYDRKVFLENLLNKIILSHDEVELANILKECNIMLKEKGKLNENLIEKFEEINEMKNNDDTIKDLIQDFNIDENNDFESLYEELNDDHLKEEFFDFKKIKNKDQKNDIFKLDEKLDKKIEFNKNLQEVNFADLIYDKDEKNVKEEPKKKNDPFNRFLVNENNEKKNTNDFKKEYPEPVFLKENKETKKIQKKDSYFDNYLNIDSAENEYMPNLDVSIRPKQPEIVSKKRPKSVGMDKYLVQNKKKNNIDKHIQNLNN
jgi:hypothetical protein